MKKWTQEKLAGSTRIKCLLTIAFFLFTVSCTYNDIRRTPTCATSTLAISSIAVTNESSCLIKNGAAEILVTGGIAPYSYSLIGQPAQTKNLFSALSAGEYAFVVQDAKGCSDTSTFSIANFESKLSATGISKANSLCEGGNGSLRVRPKNGLPPFSFKLENQVFTKDSVFSNLRNGKYNVSIVDALQCEFRFSAEIPRANTGVSWSNDVKSIVTISCAKLGCHVSGTGRVDLSKFSNVKLYAGEIRARVINKSMPYDSRLSDSQIQLIACWVEDGAVEN